MTRRVRRYGGLAAATVLLVAVGVGTGTPTLLVAGVVPLAFVIQGALSTLAPLDGRVRIEREIRPEAPLPGQPVEVTLTATNVGESVVPDLRVRDGVPEELAVRDGSESTGAALRSSESTTATYTLTANRGRYAFEPVRLRASSVSGTVVDEATREADGAAAFECRIDAEDVPLCRRTAAFTGSCSTSVGGGAVTSRVSSRESSSARIPRSTSAATVTTSPGSTRWSVPPSRTTPVPDCTATTRALDGAWTGMNCPGSK